MLTRSHKGKPLWTAGGLGYARIAREELLKPGGLVRPWQTAIPRTKMTKAIGVAHNTLIRRSPKRIRGTSPHWGGSQELGTMLSLAC